MENANASAMGITDNAIKNMGISPELMDYVWLMIK